MDSSKSETRSQTGTETKSDEKDLSLADALGAEFDRQTAEPVEAAPPVETQAKEDVSASDETDPEASTEDIAPPEHWSDEDKAAFLAMDESGRQWALRLEANAHKGIQAKSEELKRLRGPIDEYKHLFQGIDETEGLRRLLNAQQILQRNPTEGLRWLMKNLGVDEKQFAPQPQTPADDPFVDPEIKALREKVKSLESNAETQLRNQQAARQNEMLARIQQFTSATDDQGNLMYPHAQKAFPTMAGLLQAGRATDLEDAYNQAIWALPEYRDEVIARQVEQKAKDELAKRVKDADEAKQKARAVNGKGSAKQPPKDQSVYDALSEAYDKSVRGES